MPPDAPLVQRWLDKGDHDRSAATRLFTPGCTELAIIGFLCQQAIEKYLKAFLVSRDLDPPRSHDLRALAEVCVALDGSFSTWIDRLSPLTAFAVLARYPGPAEPSRRRVEEAIDAMNSFREFVLSRL